MRTLLRIAICLAVLGAVESSARAFVSPGYARRPRSPLVGKWRLVTTTYKGNPMPTPQGFVVDIGEEAIGGSVGALAGSRYEIVERTDEHLLVKIVRSNGGETTYDVRLENETMLVRIAQATNEKIEMTFERE